MARPPQNRRNPGPKAQRITEVYKLAAEDGLSYREIAKKLGVSPATVCRAMEIAVKTIPPMERAVARQVAYERNRMLWERGISDLLAGHPPAQMISALAKVNDQFTKMFGVNEETGAPNIIVQQGGVSESALAAAVEEARAQQQEILSRDRDGA